MASAVDMSLTIDDGEAAQLAAGLHRDPHAVLGGSLAADSAGRPCVLVRAWRPEAVAMAVLIGDERVEMERIHPAGLFATAVPGDGVPDYRLEVGYSRRRRGGRRGSLPVLADRRRVGSASVRRGAA